MGNKKKLLSVVVTTYERDLYLREALNSVFSDVNGCDDVEIIVLDNNSENKNIKKIVSEYDGVRFIKNETNIGLFGNWNKAFKVSCGEYVYIFGDDDIVVPGFVDAIKTAINENEFLDLVYTDYLCIDEIGNCVARVMPVPLFGYVKKSESIDHALSYGPSLPTISMCYRRQLFEFDAFDENNFGSNDWFYVYTKMPWKKAFGIDKKLIQYRKHGDGISDTRSAICNISIFIMLWEINGHRLHFSKAFLFKLISAILSYQDLLRKKETYNDNVYMQEMCDWINKHKILVFYANSIICMYRSLKYTKNFLVKK